MKKAALLGLCFSLITFAHAQTGNDLLKAANDKLKAAKSATGTMEVIFPMAKPQTWKFKLLKPNLYEIIAPDQEFRFDGKAEYQYLPETKQYQVVDRNGMSVNDAPFLFGLQPFFASAALLNASHFESAKIDNKDLVAYTVQQAGFDHAATLYVDPSTSLPYEWLQPLDNADRITIRYTAIKLDEPLKPEQFAWTPPKGAKTEEARDYEASLLKAGTPAPNAKLQTTNGTPVTLSEVFQNHKATLLYFWSSPAPLPDLTGLVALDKQYRAQGLRIITVSFSSDREKIMAYLKNEATPFQNVWDKGGAAAKLYGIQVPTTYLVNQQGNVIGHSVGYDPGAISRVLRANGFQDHKPGS